MSFANSDETLGGSAPSKQGLSGCAIAGIGCGVILGLMLIAAGIGAWWLKNNGRQFGTDLAVNAMRQGLKELDVPNDERDRIHARIDDVGQQFKDGKLTMQQVGAIFEQISEGPLMSAGMSLFFKRAYLRDSGLSEEELAAADLAVQRFARGVIDKSIPEAKREELLDMVSDKDSQGRREFRKSLTDDELRAFLAGITEAADEAGVPEEVPEINFADEFDEAVDMALGKFAEMPSQE